MSAKSYRNAIKQIALLRSKLKGTTFSQELAKMKAELEEELIIKAGRLNRNQ